MAGTLPTLYMLCCAMLCCAMLCMLCRAATPAPPLPAAPPQAHLTVPVHRGAHAAQLAADAVAILTHPLPHLCQEPLAACRAQAGWMRGKVSWRG